MSTFGSRRKFEGKECARMATAKFGQIQGRLHAKKPFKAEYNHPGAKPGDRVLCPHVIGHRKKNSTADAEERVLCYQTAGPDSLAWRSFVVSDLNIVNLNPPDAWVTPANYSQFQGNIHNVTEHVPYPP